MKKRMRLHLLSGTAVFLILFLLWYLKYGGSIFPEETGLFSFQPADEGESEGFRLSESSSEEPEAVLTVYVSGAVVSPGVYFMKSGDRAYLAVEKAGGFLPEADRDAVNLALPLKDGEQLKIPLKSASKEAGEPADQKVNINTAGTESLMTLSGIGEAKARAIIAYRQRNGPFETPEEVKNVSGIGEALYQNIADFICTE